MKPVQVEGTLSTVVAKPDVRVTGGAASFDSAPHRPVLRPLHAQSRGCGDTVEPGANPDLDRFR